MRRGRVILAAGLVALAMGGGAAAAAVNQTSTTVQTGVSSAYAQQTNSASSPNGYASQRNRATVSARTVQVSLTGQSARRPAAQDALTDQLGETGASSFQDNASPSGTQSNTAKVRAKTLQVSATGQRARR